LAVNVCGFYSFNHYTWIIVLQWFSLKTQLKMLGQLVKYLIKNLTNVKHLKFIVDFLD